MITMLNAEDLKAHMIGTRITVSDGEFKATGKLTRFSIEAEADTLRRNITGTVAAMGKTAGVTIVLDGKHELNVPINASVTHDSFDS